MEFLGPDGLRLDGRRAGELRRLRAEVGSLPTADGSATFEMGNTKAVAAVYGPREASGRASGDPTRAQIRVEIDSAPFSSEERRAKRGAGERRAAEAAAAVRAGLEATVLSSLLPRTQIDVAIQIMANDGGGQAAAFNAAVLALADAGVPMRAVAAAAGAAAPPGAGALLDPSALELRGDGPEVRMALLLGSDEAAFFAAENRAKPEELDELADLAAAGCRAVGGVLREALLSHAQRGAAALGA